MERKITKIPLLITKSENIEGLLTIDSANKYKVGLIESINFKTFCALNNQTSNYDNNYVILSIIKNWLAPYVEPFTNESITGTDRRIIRGSGNYINLVYTGNDWDIKELTLSILGQIFPDEKSLDEYKTLLGKFAKENKKAFHEIEQIKKEIHNYPSKKIENTPNSERGMEIYKQLIKNTENVDKILTRLYENIDELPNKKIYTIKR